MFRAIGEFILIIVEVLEWAANSSGHGIIRKAYNACKLLILIVLLGQRGALPALKANR